MSLPSPRIHGGPPAPEDPTAAPDAPVKQHFPAREQSVIQTSPGAFAVDVMATSVAGVGLLRRRVFMRSVAVTVLDPAYVGFAIPVSWTGDYVINGQVAKPHALYMAGDFDSVHVRGDQRDTLGIVVPRDVFVETVAALRGVGPEDVTLTDLELQLMPAAGISVRRRLAAIIEEACSGRSTRASEDIANDAVTLITDAYLHARPGTAPRRSRLRPPERIVRAAEECFEAQVGARISLADVCAAAGVSKSTLYLAFQQVYSEPPLEYFRKRQLTQARSLLLRAAPERGSVKRAALEVGLTELGRFSVEYRRLFGESPSATLTVKAP